MPFVPPAGATVRHIGHNGTSVRSTRRPRRCICARARVRAVFLPREPADADEGATMAGGNSETEEEERLKSPNMDDVVTYVPRQDSIERILEGASPEYESNTWVARRERQSLSTVRGRSSLSLGAEELNEQLRPGHLERHRHVIAPDEAFAAIFVWDTVVANSRALDLQAWNQVAEEMSLPPPDLDDLIRSEGMAPEAAVQRVFLWTRDWGDIKRYVHRHHEILSDLHDSFIPDIAPGLPAWLHLLSRYRVKCVLCTAAHSRAHAERVVDMLGLREYFARSEIVSAEDEFETLEQMYLVAAIKAQRAPQKCVIFTDRPAGIAAAHDVSAKAVALIGPHPAYEVKGADETIANYGELVVYNIRRLFSEAGEEIMDPQTHLAKDA